jgi:hypothetical protein
MNNFGKFLGLAMVVGTLSASAQVTMTALSSFGGGDGWLAPGEGGYIYLTTGNNERGIAYGNGDLYLVNHTGGANNIRILNPLTGADIGSLNTTGISGGTFGVNTIGVGQDGTIYAANLTTQSTTSPFRVYSWANNGATPTVAYSGNGGLAGSRLGDSLAVIGSGASTLLAAGYNSSPVVTGNNGYAILNPTAGTATAIGFTGTPPNAGDFRLGLTFTDSSHVLGTAGSSLYRSSSFSGSSGTLLASPAIPDPAGATADRLLAYTLLGGEALLAIQSIGDSHVSIYNATDPNNPIYIASLDNTTGTLTANGNGTGELVWGAITANPDGSVSENLYGMSSNQGIQAFIVTVPEPGTLALLAIGLAAVVTRKKFRH